MFEAAFVDPAGIGDYGRWGSVSPEIVAEVSRRTPGFNGWQQERWWTHCGDAAAFLGLAGRRELETAWQGAIEALRLESGYTDGQWKDYYAAIDRDHGPTAYVFRCLHCGQLGGYSDTH
jgi:uncharacterized protein CbrC (UPF0167 family)